MATAKAYYVKAGDTRPHFIVALREAGAKPLSEMPVLCRLTVTHISTGDVLVDNMTMAVESIPERKFRYTWTGLDLVWPGDCQAVLYLEFADGGRQHAPTRGYVPIIVEPTLG